MVQWKGGIGLVLFIAGVVFKRLFILDVPTFRPRSGLYGLGDPAGYQPPGAVPSWPLDSRGVAALLDISLGLSAWKACRGGVQTVVY